MQESESLFDMVLGEIVAPLERRREPMPVAVISCPMPPAPAPEPLEPAARDDHSAGELIREHSPEVREVLRRAGLSMAAELDAGEITRAREAAELFTDPRTEALKIRRHIMPRADEVDAD